MREILAVMLLAMCCAASPATQPIKHDLASVKAVLVEAKADAEAILQNATATTQATTQQSDGHLSPPVIVNERNGLVVALSALIWFCCVPLRWIGTMGSGRFFTIATKVSRI